MTKEELEKEADKYADDYATPDLNCSFRANMFEASKEGYLAGAEPREKRIAELEKEIARLTTNEKSLLAERKIIVKENAELKEHLKCLITGMYHIAQHHPTMGARTKIIQDLREAEQFLNSEVEK